MPEIHEDDGEQDETGKGEGDDGPLTPEGVPLLRVDSSKDNDEDDEGIEPAGIHEALSLRPVAAHYVAIEEEGEIHEQLAEAGVVHEGRWGAAVTLCPGEGSSSRRGAWTG